MEQMDFKDKFVVSAIAIITLGVILMGACSLFGLVLVGLDNPDFKRWLFEGMFPIFITWTLGVILTDTDAIPIQR